MEVSISVLNVLFVVANTLLQGANMRFLNVSHNLHFPLTHQPDDKLSLFHAFRQGKIVKERHKGHLVSGPLELEHTHGLALCVHCEEVHDMVLLHARQDQDKCYCTHQTA